MGKFIIPFYTNKAVVWGKIPNNMDSFSGFLPNCKGLGLSNKYEPHKILYQDQSCKNYLIRRIIHVTFIFSSNKEQGQGLVEYALILVLVKIVQFQTDEDGFFKIPLGPGETILILESPEGKPFPYGADQPIVVRQAEYTRLDCFV